MTESLATQSDLRTNTVAVTCNFVLRGVSGCVHQELLLASGLREYVNACASVEILEDQLEVDVTANVTSSTSYHIAVCLIPVGHLDSTGELSWPTTVADTRTVAKSARLQRNEFGDRSVKLGFPHGVVKQLKSPVLLGAPPQVVINWSSAGTDGETSATVHIGFTVRCSGIPFVQTWPER
jgi:hypothetical protein